MFVSFEYANEESETYKLQQTVKFKFNISSDVEDYCKERLQHRAEITFKLASNSLSVTVMSRRLSFYDKLSAFGKKRKFVHVVSSDFYQVVFWGSSPESVF